MISENTPVEPVQKDQAPSPGRDASRGRVDPVYAAVAALLALVLVSYWNSLTVPFILDDLGSITSNSTIRQLWPPTIIFPKHMAADTVGGRPLLNFTFALNYALHGYEVWGYHLFNVLVHAANSILLFLILRRCLLTLPEGDQLRERTVWLALAASALWAAHPLNTQAVTYIVQRAESLAGLFYLLVLYCLLMADGAKRGYLWLAGGAAACLAGMLTKEIAVTAPAAALLFDRAFLSGSFRAALKKRWGFHLALWSAAAVPFLLLASTGFHGNTTGLTSLEASLKYLQTEVWVLVDYLRLALLPDRLIFHYGGRHHEGFWNLLPSGIILGALLAATVYANVRRPKIGFPAALFFLVLAPTSSFIPIIDPQFEHRMYLPLMAVTALAAVFIFCFVSRLAGTNARRTGLILAVLFTAATAALAAGTISRNRVYQDELVLWEDVVRKLPECGPAWSEIGRIHMAGRRVPEAVEAYRRSLTLWPDYDPALGGLTKAYLEVGDRVAALATVERILAKDPKSLFGRYTKASLYLDDNRPADGRIILYQLSQDYLDDSFVQVRIGNLYATRKMPAEAVEHYERASRLEPAHSGIRNNLGLALLQAGDAENAVLHLQLAVKLDANNRQARENLAAALAEARKSR